jgi:hypothetical protein
MKARELLLIATTVASTLAFEHDREDRDFRELDRGRGEGTWWIWVIVGLVFFLCLLGMCAGYMYDWKFDGDDGYENPSATAYASTRTFPVLPPKKRRHHEKKSGKHHHHKHSSMVLPIFSDAPIPVTAFSV